MTELGNIDFKRDRWGRPLIEVDGEPKPVPYTRISSFGSVLENQFGLNKWKMRTMLRGSLDRPDLRARAESRIDDDKFLDDIVEQMIEHGGGSKAANLGTAIHEVLAQVNLGHLDPAHAPADFRPHVDGWLAALEAHELEVHRDACEVHLVNDEFRAAGSADVFLRRNDGTLVACDIKTGKAIAPRPLAYMVQLYLYATSQRYDVLDPKRLPIGDVDQNIAYIAHMPAGTGECTFYEVDLVEARRLTILAAEVKKAEKGDKVRATGVVRTPGATVERGSIASPLADPAPVADRIEWLRGRLRTIIDTDPDVVVKVRAGWPTGVATLKDGNLSNDDCTILARFFDTLERDLNIPFGATDPGAPKTGTRKGKPVTDEERIRDAFPDAVLIDDKAPLTEQDMENIKRAHAALNPDQRVWVDSLSKQATAAGVSMSLKMHKTRGRAEKVKAVLACSELAEAPDVVGTLLRTVTGHAQTIPDFGRVFGSLTIDQAMRLQRIVANLANGTANLVFDGDTVTEIGGDIA